MKKWLSKVIFLSLLGGLLVSSCLEPVDYGKLAQDKKVRDYVEGKRGLVRYLNKTTDFLDDGIDTLKEGNKMITGLQPGKYYMVEMEEDHEDVPINEDDYPKYVTDLHDNPHRLMYLGHITHVKAEKGDAIYELTNRHRYTIRDAKPFEIDGVKWSYINSDRELIDTIADGVITLETLLGDDFTMKFTDIDNYEYVKIPISPTTSQVKQVGGGYWEKITISGGEFSIKQDVGTVYDYVFVNPEKLEDFWVLRVKGEKAKGGIFILDVDYNEKSLVIDGEYDEQKKQSKVTIEVNKLKSRDSEVVVKVENDSELRAYQWYYMGEKMNGENKDTLKLKISTYQGVGEGYLQIGTHIFSVEAEIKLEDGTWKAYSAHFTLQISP